MQDTFAAASQFAHLQTDSGFRTMLSLMLPHLRLDAQAIKLQYNAGALSVQLVQSGSLHFPEGGRLILPSIKTSLESLKENPLSCRWSGMRWYLEQPGC